jgi:membrane protease YdiL (CAAX protease family)
MTSSHLLDPSRGPWPRRLLTSAPVRIVGGVLATALPVLLTMNIVQHAIDKPHRQVWPQLLAGALCLLAYRAFVRLTERRELPELARKPALREAFVGALIGCTLVCTVCAVLGTAGFLHVAGRGDGNPIKPFAEMALAATFEEVLFRAVLFRILAGWLGTRVAFVASSLLFALAHLPNNGFSLLAFLAVAMAGMLLAAAYLVHRRLWLPLGLHFGWNYTLDGVFGLSSSGEAAHGILQTQVSGPQWLSGGGFGVEASLVTVVVLAVATGLLLALHTRRPAAAPALTRRTA